MLVANLLWSIGHSLSSSVMATLEQAWYVHGVALVALTCERMMAERRLIPSDWCLLMAQGK